MYMYIYIYVYICMYHVAQQLKTVLSRPLFTFLGHTQSDTHTR